MKNRWMVRNSNAPTASPIHNTDRCCRKLEKLVCGCSNRPNIFGTNSSTIGVSPQMV
jgi:hypothetical protein